MKRPLDCGECGREMLWYAVPLRYGPLKVAVCPVCMPAQAAYVQELARKHPVCATRDCGREAGQGDRLCPRCREEWGALQARPRRR